MDDKIGTDDDIINKTPEELGELINEDDIDISAEDWGISLI